jgi:hypothetical protein
MASFLRRQDDLQNLRVRNLQIQGTTGAYPADQSILTISGTTGYVVTSSSITVQNLTTCGLTAADGRFTVNCPTGNTDISANLQVNGYINQGDNSVGTNNLNLNGNGNPNIQITAKEGGNGQAYIDLVTQKTSTTFGGNNHVIRSIIGNSGAYTLFHQAGITTYQEMAWNASGTQIALKPGTSQPITFIQGVGTKSRSFVTSDTAANPTITGITPPGTTTLANIVGADFPLNIPATRRYNIVFKDQASYVWPTFVDVGCFNSGVLQAQISGPGTLPAGWLFSIVPGPGNTSAILQINTVSIGESPPFSATLNYVTFGAQ